MDVTSKLVFTALVVALTVFLCLTDGRLLAWVLEIGTFRSDSWRKDLLRWIFFREDDSLRKPVLVAFYGIMLGLVRLT
jgi:hypothetical protein